jgi:hypothetical protein
MKSFKKYLDQINQEHGVIKLYGQGFINSYYKHLMSKFNAEEHIDTF